MYDIYLAHHGIKGQKWGVRRYQNQDGSLSQEGKNRYLKKLEQNEKITRKYENYKKNYELINDYKSQLGPKQWARWVTSGAASAQRNRMKKLEKASDKAIARTNDIITKLSEKYVLSYNVSTGTYELKDK